MCCGLVAEAEAGAGEGAGWRWQQAAARAAAAWRQCAGEAGKGGGGGGRAQGGQPTAQLRGEAGAAGGQCSAAVELVAAGIQANTIYFVAVPNIYTHIYIHA